MIDHDQPAARFRRHLRMPAGGYWRMTAAMPRGPWALGLWALLHLLPGAPVQAQTTPASGDELRLPGIHRRWARPEDAPKPETTIEAMAQCMGQDQGLRQRLPALKARQTELEAQRLDITNEQNAIQRSKTSLEAARKALADSTTAFERNQQDMSRRRNELTSLGSKPAASPAEAKRVQDLIERFNADLRSQEPRRQALLSQQKEFNQQVATYNTQVNALNERAAPWDARWQAFVQDMKALNDTAASHQLQCAGERTLAKPDTPPDVLSPP